MQSKQPPPDPKHIALVKLLPDEIVQWGIWHQEKPLPTYCKGRVAILGDAAHACAPYLSTGAGQGYEDALVIAELFKAVLQQDNRSAGLNTAVQQALQTHSYVRRKRTQYVVQSSFEAGELLMGARSTFDEAAREYAERNDIIWRYDIKGVVEFALACQSEVQQDQNARKE